MLADVAGLVRACSRCLIFCLDSGTFKRSRGRGMVILTLSIIWLDPALLLSARGVGAAKLRVRHSFMPQHEQEVLAQFACLR